MKVTLQCFLNQSQTMRNTLISGSRITALLLIAACSTTRDAPVSPAMQTAAANSVAAVTQARDAGQVTGRVSVYARGLQNPRGLKFSPDGILYVAEGGTGGTNSTVGSCEQVPIPVGPYLGSRTGGRISRISSSGVRSTVTDQLPSSSANEIIGGDVEGVADIAFIDDAMYALVAGGGCSHGVAQAPGPRPNGVVRVRDDGSWSYVANLSAWSLNHPVANPELDDFEPDGTPYSMVAVRGALYAVEPNHGELLRITTAGDVSRVLDISASQGHAVPTALAYRGNFFVGNLHPFPNPGGASSIWKITPSGQITLKATGLNMVLGLVVADDARMYVLEMTAGAPFPTPGLGRVLRIDPSGAKTVIASGLTFPTGMTLGPDGNLYVSNVGFSPASTAGGGQVLRIEIADH